MYASTSSTVSKVTIIRLLLVLSSCKPEKVPSTVSTNLKSRSLRARSKIQHSAIAKHFSTFSRDTTGNSSIYFPTLSVLAPPVEEAGRVPLLSIEYIKMALQVISDQDCYLTINLKGTLLNEHIRKEIANNKYMYYGENKIAIMNGMIGSIN